MNQLAVSLLRLRIAAELGKEYYYPRVNQLVVSFPRDSGSQQSWVRNIIIQE